MLFAFSDINTEKFEKVSVSMANSFGVAGKPNQTNNEEIITSGMSQITGLDNYYARLGIEEYPNGTSIIEKSQDSDTDSSSNKTTDSSTDNNEADINKAIATINKKMATVTAQMYDEASDLSDQYSLNDYVDLNIDPDNKYVEITLKGSLLYDSGEAGIKRKALPILKNVSKILKKFDGCNIEITGYTDNVPITDNSSYKDNKWLSSARALNAAQYLIAECKMDPSRIKYSGRGEYEPIASNATEKGRAKNRRISIKIYNKYSSE